MPRKHAVISADPTFAKALAKAQAQGATVGIAGVRIYPPRGAGKYWRLHASHMGEAVQKSGGKTIETAYHAYCELQSWLAARIAGSMGEPAGSSARLCDVLEAYINGGGPNYIWKARTRQDRARDLKALTVAASAQNLTCSEFNADHLRTFANKAASTAARGQFLIKLVATFLAWGYKVGHFTHEQVLMTQRVAWSAPAGSGYVARPTRRRQSQMVAATEFGAGGEVPTHEQVADLAVACQKYYAYGEGLIHVAANTGLRSGELRLLTASSQIARAMQGNLVDIDSGVVKVQVQPNDDPTQAFKTTKNGKSRSVVIPPVTAIATGFDVQAWLSRRCLDALEEQARGENPRALLFPNSRGGVLDANNLSNRIVGKAAADLGWRMPAHVSAKGRALSLRRFTLHSMRDRFATTAVQEWGYSQVQLLDQGSWADMQTVQKFYLGTTDQTLQSVRNLHSKAV